MSTRARQGAVSMVLAVWLVLHTPVGEALARGAFAPKPGASVHNLQRGRPQAQVTSIAFSPDSKHVVASYFVPAMNIIFTDWGAWTAQWDLTNAAGPLIIPSACQPATFSPDGKIIAMAAYERSHKRALPHSPQSRLALWKPGREFPLRELQQPDTDRSVVVATAFHPGGKHVVASTARAGMLLWDVEKGGHPKVLITAAAGSHHRRLRSWPVWMAFSEKGDLLAVSQVVGLRRHRDGSLGVSHSATLWDFSLATETLNRPRTYRGGFIVWDAAAVRVREKLKKESIYPFGCQSTDRVWQDLTSQYDYAATSPDQRTLALGRGSKITLRRYDGTVIRELSHPETPPYHYVGFLAFSPDGKYLAAADHRAVIRLWEVDTGKLTHTLRLEDPQANSPTVLVAAVQCQSKFGDPAANRKHLEKFIRRAAWRGAQIVVLPETAVTGYLSFDLKTTWQAGSRPVTKGLRGVEPKDVAETVPGPSTEFFGKLARELRIYLTVPIVEIDHKTGNYYNTSVLLGPAGRIRIHYRKCDPWPWAERGWAAPGNLGNPVVETRFGRLGLLICYDIHAQARIMGEKKTDTLLYSVAWVDEKDSKWYAKRLPAIANTHGFNIVAANWTVPRGPGRTWHGYGQSCVIDAKGRVLAKAADDLDEQIVYARLPHKNAFLDAVKRGNVAMVRAGLDLYPQWLTMRDGHGHPLMYWVGVGGHKDLALLLIAGGTDVKGHSEEGTAALLRAAYGGHKDLVELLLNHGTSVNTRDKAGWAALHLAARKRHKEVVELLLAGGANIEAKAYLDWTPLHLAVLEGGREMTALLLARGADPSAKDKRGRTPLQLAIEKGRKDVVNLLRRHHP